MNIVQTNKQMFDDVIDFLKNDISSLRTGRATPVLVEDISVEAYGTRQQLKGVASITVLDAKTLAIEPWDKSLMQAVESGIRNSSLGINPVNDGKVIRLPLPALTTERRAELIKVLHQKLEAARISLRKAREELRDKIDKAEKNNEISEDEKFSLQEALEKMVRDCNDKVKTIGEDKEKEITNI